MKEQLTSLAKEKGFESKVSIIPFFGTAKDGKAKLVSVDEDLIYYLWLCELQKWMMDKHYIHIDTETELSCESEMDTYFDIIRFTGNVAYCEKIKSLNEPFTNHDEGFVTALFEALKLIK